MTKMSQIKKTDLAKTPYVVVETTCPKNQILKVNLINYCRGGQIVNVCAATKRYATLKKIQLKKSNYSLLQRHI